MTWLDLLAALYPRPVDPSDELRRSVSFLGWEATAGTVVRAGYGIGVVGVPTVPVVSTLAPPSLALPATLAAVALVVLAVHLVHTIPRVLATAKRARALGAAPDLVARAVIGMRIAPSPEWAGAFAAESGEGVLAEGLSREIRSPTVDRTPLVALGERWREWFPSFGRALSLVAAAGEMPPEDRDRTLDRALTVVTDGTRTRMREFATRIRGPATALYAFGVLLPTALIALLPAARAAGVGITGWTVVVVYDLLLPASLAGAAVWLLARRPVAFPPPAVSLTHPDVPDRRVIAGLAGGAGVAAGWLLAGAVLPSWAAPIAAIGYGVGLALVVLSRPILSVHERVRSVEDGLTDALSLLGREIADGTAVEAALPAAAERVDGPMGRVLAEASRRQRQLGVGVREAIDGTLTDLPSPRVTGSMNLVALAADEGSQAGSAILALADHVDDLGAVERASRQELDQVCGTLGATAAVFGPLVAGATVSMADGITAGGALPAGGQSIPWLGLAVGWYVLVLAAILTALATGLGRGFDRALVGYRVGRALLAATTIYLATYLVVGGLA